MRHILIYLMIIFIIVVTSPIALTAMNKEKTLTKVHPYLESKSAHNTNDGHLKVIITAQINESDKVGSEDIDTEDMVGDEDRVGNEDIDTEDIVDDEDKSNSEDIDTEDEIEY